MTHFHPDSYLVRIFDFIRFFQMPHTINDAMDRFEISQRSVYRYFEDLYVAGITIEPITKANGYKGDRNLYQLKQLDLPTL